MLARLILLAIAFAVAGGYLLKVDAWAAALAFVGTLAFVIAAITVGVRASLRRRHAHHHAAGEFAARA